MLNATVSAGGSAIGANMKNRMKPTKKLSLPPENTNRQQSIEQNNDQLLAGTFKNTRDLSIHT